MINDLKSYAVEVHYLIWMNM